MPILYPTTNDMSSIIAALESFGIIGTKYYSSTSNFVFDTPLYPGKVLKLELYSGRWRFYWGDAWTSLATITNQVEIVSGISSSATRGTVAYNGALLISNYCSTAPTNFALVLIDEVVETGEKIIISTSNFVNSAFAIKPVEFTLITPSITPIVDANGYYYTGDILVAKGDILIGKLAHTKFITKPKQIIDSIKYGNHLYAPADYCSGMAYFFPCSFLLENAA